MSHILIVKKELGDIMPLYICADIILIGLRLHIKHLSNFDYAHKCYIKRYRNRYDLLE